METIESVLEFWFGNDADDSLVASQKSALWWGKDAALDDEIRHRFSACLSLVKHGDLQHWSSTPRGRLALILLTDQFPRNIYRDTVRAFSLDDIALVHCKEGIGGGQHTSLRPIQRVFFYLPLEHSESIQDQQQSVSLFEALASQVDPRHKDVFDGYLDFARRHQEIILRFGRFPHRNALLGRGSTAEEREFLTQRGSSF